jgi:hypothetical protein
MRSPLLLVTAVATAALVAVACGTNGSTFEDETAPDGGGGGSSGSSSGSFNNGEDDGGGTDTPSTALDIDTATMRIDPADAVLTVTPGQKVSQTFKVFGKLKGSGVEQDLTSRVVFYVPDNFLVGTFPLDGGSLFTSRLPAASTDPPQRGGKLTVEATASNSNGIVKATTGLTVKLVATFDSPNLTPSLPANPASKFVGAPFAPRNPSVAYPNNGAMLPPNLRRLEVHWKPGLDNQLFEVSFKSATSEIVYYSRCGGGSGFEAGSCAFELDEAGYGYLAESNRGSGPVKLRVRGTDDAAIAHGESTAFDIEFAENRVDGGLYYWKTSEPQGIMRFDFGAPTGIPEAYILENEEPRINQCPGCHALSRDGKKLVASLGGQQDGRLLFINDLARPKSDPAWLTVNPNDPEPFSRGKKNRIQFASFNPDGSKFVAVYGDNATAPVNPDITPDNLDKQRLWFHDGLTGLRDTFKQLTYKPNHPDWAPNGDVIAITRVGDEGTTTQRPKEGSIEILTRFGNAWNDPVSLVPKDPNKKLNRFNPNFVPDSSFLYYTESDCDGPMDDSGSACDADADWRSFTWAVKPQPGSVPIKLAKAALPGVGDGANTDMGDTFPRSAPFQTKHLNGKLFWFTVASRRKMGLRIGGGAQHLWMFAIDPAKILAGQDGSFPGFFLPFQDLQTSNHIAQWTEKIVGGNQDPPPPPPVPPPPPPPPPPPVPK